MSTKRRGLGRGLSALIPDEGIDILVEEIDGEKIVNIDIMMIEPNNEQPRREFNEDKINELANSIKIHGVLQPILVRKTDDGYQIIAGERRWRAAKSAGLKEIPCIVKDIKQLQSTKIALIENLQREDLNPIEEAIAYKGLIEKHGLTQEEISDVIGKSRSYVANITRLLNLDKRVIDFISNSKISSGHGRALLALENHELQYKAAQMIIEKELNVRETEKLVKELSKNKIRKVKQNKQKDPSIIEIEETLRKLLGTKVSINSGRKKGKIEIEYYNETDLERILDTLIK